MCLEGLRWKEDSFFFTLNALNLFEYVYPVLTYFMFSMKKKLK